LTPEPGNTVFVVSYNGCYLDTFGARVEAELYVAECEAYDAELHVAA
jgi:hypothetical protein